MKFELFEHNRIAYASAVEMMEEVGKAAIIHPTGTGKSFIGFQLAADHPQEQILWLSPSRYIFETQMENLKAASSESETLDNIEFLTYAKLMLMDQDEIAELHPAYIILDEFHCCGAQMWGQGVQRLLDTYPDVPILGLSATNIRYLDNQRDMAQELFDGNIASEITLGEAIVRGILNPPKYVLSIFKYQDDLVKYEARVRNARSKAVRDEGERYLEALRRALENADGLDVIFDKHMTDRTGKYIIFCANKAHMDEMMEHLEWFAKVDRHPHVYSLYTEDPSASKEFDDFKADNDHTHLRLLYCIDALNQGIHVPDISGVILLRPTVSPIIYKQQIGRALSAVKHTASDDKRDEMTCGKQSQSQLMPENKKFSSNLSVQSSTPENEAAKNKMPGSGRLGSETAKNKMPGSGHLESQKIETQDKDNCPVIFDIVMNIENLYSIGAIEEEMELATAYYRSLGESEYVVNERFKVIDEVRDCVELFNSLNDVLTASWDLMYEKAKAYYEENGDLNVQHRYVTADGYSLGSWVSTQRAVRAGSMHGSLTKEQIEKLSAIGMVWESRRELAWTKNYNAAKAYYDEHGTLDAPVDYVTEDGVALGAWLKSVRNWRSGGVHQKYLTNERINELNAIGMTWNLHDYYWDQMYRKAEEYYQAHGNLDVPDKYVTEDGMRLGSWIHRQRNLGKGRNTDKTISPSTDEQEISSGKTTLVLTETKDTAKACICSKQDCGKPDCSKQEGAKLDCYKPDHNKQDDIDLCSGLSQERIQRLNAIGMIWTEGNEANWDKNFELARQYYLTHGNMNVPRKYETDGVNLGYWVMRQKTAYRSGKLSDYRKAKLESIGVAPAPVKNKDTDTWEFRARLAKKYVDENDVRCISQGVVIDGIWIGKWLAVQRKALEAGRLTTEQKKLLEGIPFQTKGEEAWNNAYALAQSYYEEHGNLDVPKKYISSNGYGLGNWVSYQRKLRREGSLTEEQIRRLDAIGFRWESRRTVA